MSAGSRGRAAVDIEVSLTRHRDIVAEQLMLGIICGGFAGGGLAIAGRDSSRIRFSRGLSGTQRAPDYGEVVIEADGRGTTVVQCKLWCPTIRRQQWVVGVAAGLLVGILTLAIGWAAVSRWLMVLAAPLAGATAIAVGVAGWRRELTRLARQMETFVHNTHYLKM